MVHATMSHICVGYPRQSLWLGTVVNLVRREYEQTHVDFVYCVDGLDVRLYLLNIIQLPRDYFYLNPFRGSEDRRSWQS